MKRIGVITIVKVNNYGAELQAMATTHVLHGMGFKVEIIDYCYYKNWNFKDTRMSVPFIPLSKKGKFLYWLKYRLVNFMVAWILPIILPSVQRRNRRFEEFHRINTPMSKRYMSMPELYNAKMDYDVYIVGSDQVWNPSASSSIEPYFLTFAPKHVKKIAYASSFGVSEIEGSLQSKYKKLLENIDYISVREQSGVDLVRCLTGQIATCVLDPTLMIANDNWDSIMRVYPNMPNKYILVYQLLPSESIYHLATNLAKELDCAVYYLAKRAYGIKVPSGIKTIKDAGPAEFVWLIKNASCVITNSFHGTAFSVNFSVPFYSVLDSKRKGNARIVSLLESVDLMNRIVFEGTEIPKFSVYESAPVQQKIEGMRADSMSFLKKALDITIQS